MSILTSFSTVYASKSVQGETSQCGLDNPLEAQDERYMSCLRLSCDEEKRGQELFDHLVMTRRSVNLSMILFSSGSCRFSTDETGPVSQIQARHRTCGPRHPGADNRSAIVHIQSCLSSYNQSIRRITLAFLEPSLHSTHQFCSLKRT